MKWDGQKCAGDIILHVIAPGTLGRLIKAARKYDDALRIAGISRAALAEDRNQRDGDVFDARKDFLAVVEEIQNAEAVA